MVQGVHVSPLNPLSVSPSVEPGEVHPAEFLFERLPEPVRLLREAAAPPERRRLASKLVRDVWTTAHPPSDELELAPVELALAWAGAAQVARVAPAVAAVWTIEVLLPPRPATAYTAVGVLPGRHGSGLMF